MKAQGFPRWLRIRRRGDFLRVQRTGRKHHMRNFLVFVTTGQPRDSRASERDATRLPVASPPRLGITVTRKIGNAVARNRIKRFVREAFRRERKHFAAGLDLVWVAKRNAAGVSYPEVMDDMVGLTRRLQREAPVRGRDS